jgi:para-aminobenzoate synthetase
MKTLLIDNYDSFTFNLFQLIAEVNGEEPLVVRNDGASWSELEGWGVDNIVISPGPGRPERPTDFGVCSDAIRLATVPVLGVCLGHQGLGHLSGGTVVHAPEVMHGRLSTVYHNGSELFAGIPQGFEAVRYHSLCVLSPPPEGLEVIAWTADDLIMGLRDLHRPRWGVQFHPESISTTYGRELLENFRALTEKFGTSQKPTAASRSRTILPRRTIADRRGPIEPSLELKVRKLDHAPDPERAFVHLFGGDSHAWWLDSSKQGDERSAFSFMGGSDGPLASRAYYDVVSKEVTVVRGGLSETRKQTIFDYLQDELDRFSGLSADVPFDFNCGFVGYFGYELKADCGGSLVHRSALPDAVFQFADRLIAFDHREACTYVLCLVDSETVDGGERWLDEVAEKLAALPPLPERAPANGARSKPVDFYLSRSYETYLDDIARCKQYLIDGETYEVCLTNKVKTDIHPDPLDLYRVVRNVNPAPFSAFLRDGGSAVVCSSPERFLHIGRDRWVETKPIKGTVRRGRTPSEDASLKEALCADEKTRAENLMITDLLRNDLGVVCEIGSVHVPHLFAVESYETVHQLVSTIRGRLREDLGPVDCIRACFPGGSMTGAPKKRTLEIIDELETEARGVYSGAIGYLGLCGAVDLNIVIRTIVLDDEETSIGMGGAIVMQSDAEEEYEETILKARALMKAIVLCVNGHDELAAVDETPEKELEWALRKAITGTRSRAARGETEGRPARLATPPPTRLA